MLAERVDKGFINHAQYSEEGIRMYEFVFGRNFVSSGGYEATSELLKNIKLNENSRVLDIGSGLGGGCLYFYEKYKCHVYGVDISENMYNIVKYRKIENEKIHIEACDILDKQYESNFFDLIYSRDSILHLQLHEKENLFRKCYQWLKPNGILLITDYCVDNIELWDDDYRQYLYQRQYVLLSIDHYISTLRSCKFDVVEGNDMTDTWIKLLKKELKKLADNKKEFIEEFNEETYNDLYNSWQKKIKRGEKKVQTWGHFKAIKF